MSATDTATAGIHVIDKSLGGEPVREGWGERGQPLGQDEQGCVAKRTTDPDTGNVRRWLLRASAGPECGRLYNRLSSYHQDWHLHSSRTSPQYVWKHASEECFGHYLRFLATGAEIHLLYAERSQ